MSRSEYDVIIEAIKKDIDILGAYVCNAEIKLEDANRDLADGESALAAVLALEKQNNYIAIRLWKDPPMTLADKLDPKETNREELLRLYADHLRVIGILCEEYKDSDVLSPLVVLRTLTEALRDRV